MYFTEATGDDMALKLALSCAAGGVLGYILTKLLESPKQIQAKGGTITLGYWKIRGLCAPLRMMCFYKGQPFVNKAYGDDAQTAWFGTEKKRLKETNALVNLPYVIDGPTAAVRYLTASLLHCLSISSAHLPTHVAVLCGQHAHTCNSLHSLCALCLPHTYLLVHRMTAAAASHTPRPVFTPSPCTVCSQEPKETVVTQSNSCLLYLGQRLGIDR